MNQNRIARFSFAILVVIFFVAVALRAFAASEFLWLDELHTAWVATSDWSQILERSADGNQTPLYFFVVAFLTKTFGATPLVLRSFSLFCGLLLWVTATQWTWKLTNRYVATILVAALIATDLQFVFYASEARPYVLVQLLGLWQAMTFWSLWGSSPGLVDGKADRQLTRQPAPSPAEQTVSEGASGEGHVRHATPQTRQVGVIAKLSWYVLLSVALFYTHFTSVWILAAEAIYLLARFVAEASSRSGRASVGSGDGSIGKDGETVPVDARSLRLEASATSVSRPGFWTFVLTSLITATLWVPGIWNFLNVYSRRGNWSNISSLDRLGLELYPWLVFWFAVPLAIVLFLSCLSWVASSKNGQSEKSNNGPAPRVKRSELRWLLLFLAVVGVTGPIAIAAMHIFEIAPMALIRYSAVCWVALAVFAGVSTSFVSPRWSFLFGLLILAASLWQNLLINDCVTKGRWVAYRNENWHDPICEIASGPTDTPVFQMGDVIEDVDALKIVEERFQTYLAFPLLGIDQIATDGKVDRDNQVIALPTFGERWTLAHLKEIESKGRAWLLVRGEVELEIDVVEQLRREFRSRFAKRLDFQSGDFRGPAGNPIRLLRVTVVD